MNDPSLIERISQGDKDAFDQLFTAWYTRLHAYAWSVLRDEWMAEEMVQAVFCRLWEKKTQLQVHTSLQAYLYGCVYHECMDWLRKEKTKKSYRRQISVAGDLYAAKASDKTELNELEIRLRKAMDELPEQCRAIFQLSRFGGLKYREIAEQLDISVKTVEVQMTKALKRLRDGLADLL